MGTVDNEPTKARKWKITWRNIGNSWKRLRRGTTRRIRNLSCLRRSRGRWSSSPRSSPRLRRASPCRATGTKSGHMLLRTHPTTDRGGSVPDLVLPSPRKSTTPSEGGHSLELLAPSRIHQDCRGNRVSRSPAPRKDCRASSTSRTSLLWISPEAIKRDLQMKTTRTLPTSAPSFEPINKPWACLPEHLTTARLPNTWRSTKKRQKSNRSRNSRKKLPRGDLQEPSSSTNKRESRPLKPYRRIKPKWQNCSVSYRSL